MIFRLGVITILKTFFLSTLIAFNAWTTAIGIPTPIEKINTDSVVVFPFGFYDLPQEVQPIAKQLLEAVKSGLSLVTVKSSIFTGGVNFTWSYALEEYIASFYFPRSAYLEQRYDTYQVNRPRIITAISQVENTVTFRINKPTADVITKCETKAEEYISKIESKLDQWMLSITEGLKPQSKELYLRIYRQVTSMIYNHDTVKQDLWQTVFSGLNEGTCNDVARYLKVLCDRAGIPCVYVTVYIEHTNGSKGYHAVNKVLIDGTWYWADPTADMRYDSTNTEYESLSAVLMESFPSNWTIEDDSGFHFLWP